MASGHGSFIRTLRSRQFLKRDRLDPAKWVFRQTLLFSRSFCPKRNKQKALGRNFTRGGVTSRTGLALAREGSSGQGREAPAQARPGGRCRGELGQKLGREAGGQARLGRRTAACGSRALGELRRGGRDGSQSRARTSHGRSTETSKTG